MILILWDKLYESESESHSVVSNSATPWTIQSIEFSRPEHWSSFPSPGELPNPGIEPRSHRLQSDSLPAESQGKPKNTGVGSQSLIQWIFPTQESNQCLLHCRQILYQLSYQGSPGVNPIATVKTTTVIIFTDPWLWTLFSFNLPNHPMRQILLLRWVNSFHIRKPRLW